MTERASHTPDHDHADCVSAALASADEICAARGVRLTPVRRRVLELVWQNHQAVKAYDLLEDLAREEWSAKPPTVYRALDFLMEQGLIHRIESLNAYVGCAHPDDSHSSQFLICDDCQNVIELESGLVEKSLHSAAQAKGFHPDRQTVEVHGQCADCRQR